MTTPAILDADLLDWTYDDLADELEQLAMLSGLEPPTGASLVDLGALAFRDDLALLAADLERVAQLEAR
jgi:hypothetical protein